MFFPENLSSAFRYFINYDFVILFIQYSTMTKQKRFYLIILAIASSSLAWAQSPELINYQAVARYSDGSPIAGQKIGVRIAVLEGGPEGVILYSETHKPETNEFGLFTLQIGGGASSRKFSTLNWNSGNEKWIRIEVDPANGGNYVLMGANQLVSVPFSLLSKQAQSAPPVLKQYTDEQKEQIVNPAEGSLILNTTSSSLNLFYQGDWYNVPMTRIIPEWKCGKPIIDARDGRSYKTIQIGTHCWMAENLNAGQAINLTARQTDNGIIEKYIYDNNEQNGQTYGGLYTWDEMMNYTKQKGGRGICPDGWHVPTDEEWQEMEVALGMSATDAAKSNVWRGTDQGTQLGPGGSSGFNALFSGRAVPGFGYTALGSFEYLWTSNESADAAWRRCLDIASQQVGRYNTFPKTYGMSVRCMK